MNYHIGKRAPVQLNGDPAVRLYVPESDAEVTDRNVEPKLASLRGLDVRVKQISFINLQ